MGRRRLRGDAGSTLVEFALVGPILAMFALGVLELGFLFRQDNLIERTSAVGARTASQMGNSRNADFEAIRAVASISAGARNLTINRITVYQPDSSGNMSASCRGPNQIPAGTLARPNDTSTVGVATAGQACNVYSDTQMKTLNPSAGFPGTATSCAGTAWDINWCPSDRKVTGVIGTTDRIGVYIEAQYTTLTKIFGTSRILKSQAYYVLEPTPVGSS